MQTETKKMNVLFIGADYNGKMASSMRIQNLINPLLKNQSIQFSNLYYPVSRDLCRNLSKDAGSKISSQYIGYNVGNILSFFPFFFHGCRFIYREKSKNKEKQLILYSYGYPNIENILFILFAKVLRYKIVFDIVEDNVFMDDFKTFRGKLKVRTSLLFLNRIAWLADGCCVISHHLKNKIRSISSDTALQIIPISVDLTRFSNTKQNNLQSDTTRFFYGGSFAGKDGIEQLLNAFSKVADSHNNIKLILTGTGADRHIKKLKKLLGRQKHNDKISYLGYLPSNEYFKVVSECDVMCMPRIDSAFANGGFPFKLGEYLATGNATIATRIGDVPKYLTNKKDSILVEPGSSSSMADAMIFCIQNYKERLHIGLSGRQVAESKFDAIKISNTLFNFLKKL